MAAIPLRTLYPEATVVNGVLRIPYVGHPASLEIREKARNGNPAGASKVVSNPFPVATGKDGDPFLQRYEQGTRLSSSTIPFTQHDAYLTNNVKDVPGFAKLMDGSTAAYYGEQTKMAGITFLRIDLRRYRVTASSLTIASRFMSGPLKVYYIVAGEHTPTLFTTIAAAGAGTVTYPLPQATKITGILFECPTKTDYPSEVSITGSYIAAATTPVISRPILFEDTTWANAFSWDWMAADGFTQAQHSSLFTSIHGGMRHYLDSDLVEIAKGGFVFEPSNNLTGTWMLDSMYADMKAKGVDLCVVIKNSPKWQRTGWPRFEAPSSDPGNEGMQHPEQIPVEWQGTLAATLEWAKQPAAYRNQGDRGFQFAARYGNTVVTTSRLKVAPAQLDGNGNPLPANQKKTGLNLVRQMELTNEPDSWWRGNWSFSTPEMVAAHLSAWYDGHMGTLGADIGVKNADPTMFCWMPGIAVPSMEYVKAILDWCRQYRGYRADGTINTPFDGINFHAYSNDGGAVQFGSSTTRGMAPELSGWRAKLQYVRQFTDQFLPSMSIAIGEFGFDVGYSSDQRAARPMDVAAGETQADRSNRLLVQGQWLLRSALLGWMEGIKCWMYWHRDTQPSEYDRYTTSGMVDGITPRVSARFYAQALSLLRGYTVTQVVSESPFVVKAVNGSQVAYVLWSGTETNASTTYNLSVPSGGTQYVLSTTSNTPTATSLAAGTRQIPVSETPIFVKLN